MVITPGARTGSLRWLDTDDFLNSLIYLFGAAARSESPTHW